MILFDTQKLINIFFSDNHKMILSFCDIIFLSFWINGFVRLIFKRTDMAIFA